jgi:hypothetical protein
MNFDRIPMDNTHDLLQVLDGIRAELHMLNKTLSTFASQQSRTASKTAVSSPAPYSPAKTRSSAGTGRVGGYKRKFEDGEPVGSGTELAARFPKKRGTTGKPKHKMPAKKGNGYPKKPK